MDYSILSENKQKLSLNGGITVAQSGTEGDTIRAQSRDE
jgi:hypothetical protein